MANCKFVSPKIRWPDYVNDGKDYNVVVDGNEHKDLVWWYKYPTAESAPIAGHMCFYNEKVEILVDGVKEGQ